MQLSYMIPGGNIIGRKVSVASINGAGGWGTGGGRGSRKPGVVKPKWVLRGVAP